MNATIQAAIDESILRDCIVELDDATPDDIVALKDAADDWTVNGNCLETWGQTEDGTWRVHVEDIDRIEDSAALNGGK